MRFHTPRMTRTAALGLGVFALAAGIAATMVITLSDGKEGSGEAARSGADDFSPELFRTAYLYERNGDSLEDMSEELREFVLRDQQWRREAKFLPISGGVDSLVAAWRASLRDPSGVLTPAQETALLRAIAEHAHVRAQRTPDQYIALIENDRHLEWNESDPEAPERLDTRRKNLHVGVFYRFFLERPYDPDKDLRAMLDEVWTGLDHYDHLFDEAGVGERGAEILVIKARAPGELRLWGLMGKHTLRDPKYWEGHGGRLGMQFVRPIKPGEALLTDRASLKVAFVHVLVRMKDRRLLSWNTRWYLDPDSSDWVLDAMESSASKTAMVVW